MNSSTVKKVDSAMEYTKPVFFASVGLMYFLYIILILGVSVVSPAFITNLRSFIHILVCLFLMIRFNPFRRAVLRENDQRIIFSAALFLMTTTGITDIAIYNLDKIQTFLRTFL